MKLKIPSRSEDITPEKRIFVAEYLKDFNGTRALIRTRPGIKASVASSLSQRYLSQKCVMQELTKHIHKIEEKADVTVAGIIKELHGIGTTNLKDAFDSQGCLKDIQDMPESLQKAISSIKIKGPTREDMHWTCEIKLWEKTKALELLGKNLGMWMDKLQLSGDFIVEFGHRRKQEVIDIEKE